MADELPVPRTAVDFYLAALLDEQRKTNALLSGMVKGPEPVQEIEGTTEVNVQIREPIAKKNPAKK